MKPLESDIEQAVCNWADRHCILHRKMNGVGSRHWPDRMFMLPGGRPLFIEFKREGEQPRKAQWYVIRMLQGKGYDVFWTAYKHVAIRWLEKAIAEAS
jgi:hypothetical protein